MADTIYLKTGQFSANSFKTSKNDLKRAADALNTLDYYGAMVNAMYTCNGYRHRIFTAAMAEEASSLAILIERLHGKLEAYSKLLQSGPEAIRDVDSSFKGTYTNAWQRGWYSISSGVSSVYNTTVSFWGSLFRKGGQKTGGKTSVANDQDTIPQSNSSHEEMADYERYRKTITNVDQKVPVGQSQQNERYSDGSTGGLCTYSATTTLLMRKQVVDGREPSFSFDDVYRTNGGTRGVNSDGTWPDDSSFYWTRTYSKDNDTYTMKYQSGPIDSEKLKTMLNEHPEGVIIYAPSSGGYSHAIVMTDYELHEDGTVSFFADDPVNDRNTSSGRIPLESTWLYSCNNNPLGSASMIAYLE